MQQQASPPRYQAFGVYSGEGNPGLQINEANTIHLKFPQGPVSTFRVLVGIPQWDGVSEHAVALRVGWDDAHSNLLSNTVNTTRDNLWQPVAIQPPGRSAPLAITTSAATGAWPANIASFRLVDLSIDGSAHPLAEWAFWIEEDTTCPAPQRTAGAPPTCVLLGAEGKNCSVCSEGSVEGIVSICPRARHSRRPPFQYNLYMWHGRFFWCMQRPF